MNTPLNFMALQNLQRRFTSLTECEFKVVTHTCLGKSIKQIAHLMNRSERTVENARKVARNKLGVESTLLMVRVVTQLECYGLIAQFESDETTVECDAAMSVV